MPEMSAFRRLRKKNYKFEASLGYKKRLSQKKENMKTICFIKAEMNKGLNILMLWTFIIMAMTPSEGAPSFKS